MEEIKERFSPGRISYHYCFTKTEREHLTNLLQGHDNNATEIFIDQLERDFSLMYYRVLEQNQGSTSDQAIKVRDIIFKLELALKYINKISSGQFLPMPRKCVSQDDLIGKKDSGENRHSKTNPGPISSAETARQPLQKVIEDLKSVIEIIKLRSGRPAADELELALTIGKEFEKYIGVPRPHAGPFGSIVEYCYEIITTKKGDRTRAIRQAIKTLSHL